MEKEQEELQFLGFFGIWRESRKIISTSKIFIRLGLALTLPLSFIYLANIEINRLLLKNISQTIIKIEIADVDTQSYEKSLRALLGELAVYILSQVAYNYIVFLLILSLLSTSSVVYTVACIYSGKSVTFKEAIRVVPKVWKRLMVTILSVMGIMFLYNFVFFFIARFIYLAYPLNSNNWNKFGLIGVVTLFLLYFLGLFYMGVIWQLANTISVLEESYGFQALKKSKILMKGKMGISVAISLSSNLIFVCLALSMYNSCVVTVDQSISGILQWVGLGVFTLFLLCIVYLRVLVVHTVFYLVCKSYHHELIDKNALVDLLEVYQGEGYTLLNSKDDQLMEHV